MLFISKANSKTEGTSQTFGQFILLGNIVGFKTDISSQMTNVNILKTSDAVTENLNDVKAQIAIAAASNENSTIVLSENSKTTGLFDVGNLSNAETLTAAVLNSQVKSKETIKDILIEAKKVDLSIALKSKESEKIEFNNLQIPDLEGNFNYNFFVPDEADIEIQEDPLTSVDLNNIPKFVELSWNVVDIVDDLTDEELQKEETAEINSLKNNAFKDPRGVAGTLDNNFLNSVDKSLKNLNLVNLNDMKTEIVDVHKPNKAFDSIVNEKSFSNTINTAVNINNNNELLNIIVASLK